MKFIKTDSPDARFKIVFGENELVLAYKLMQHIECADNENLEILLDVMDEVYEMYQASRPSLKLIKKGENNED
jgi:hypothetical protein